MKRRGFLATLLGGAAAAVGWSWIAKGKSKRYRRMMLHGYRTEYPSGYLVVANPKIAAKLRSNHLKFYDHDEPQNIELGEDEIGVLPGIEIDDA